MMVAAAGSAVSCGGTSNDEDVTTGQDTNVSADNGVDAVTSATQYICTVCDYVYNPAVGDPTQGIPAGTSFEDLPDSWLCPECGADQNKFEVYNP
jgi:rubredoxin